jgi:hypothetical protein
MAEVTFSEGVSELFPLTFYQYSWNGPLHSKMDFESFESFTEFLLKELAGFFNVYRGGDKVFVEKYVENAGMYTIFQSASIRR